MNQALKQELLGQYQVRKNAKQKRKFRKYAQDYCAQLDMPCAIEESRGVIPCANIVMGDIEKADMVFTAHYDTCAALPFPNLITPVNIPLYLLYQLAVILAILIPAWLVRAGTEHFFPGWGQLGWLAVFLAFLGQMMFGIANRHTANDNTSGVAAVMEIAARLPKEARERVALVLFDNEEVGMLGSKAFLKAHRGIIEKKPVINFDCVSDGENMLYAVAKLADTLPCAAAIRQAFSAVMAKAGKTPVVPPAGKALYPSDQKNFPFGVGIAALKKGRRGVLYMDRIHTSRDTAFDESNIDALARWALELAAMPEIRPAETVPKRRPSMALGIAMLAGMAIGIIAGLIMAAMEG